MKSIQSIKNRIGIYTLMFLTQAVYIYFFLNYSLTHDWNNWNIINGLILVAVIIQTLRVIFNQLNKPNNSNSTDLIDIKNLLKIK
jgi:hypothetical protein